MEKPKNKNLGYYFETSKKLWIREFQNSFCTQFFSVLFEQIIEKTKKKWIFIINKIHKKMKKIFSYSMKKVGRKSTYFFFFYRSCF